MKKKPAKTKHNSDTDNGVLCQLGVPGGSLKSRGFDDGAPELDYYFDYHHSHAGLSFICMIIFYFYFYSQ
jgi:hypothetical protein